MKYTDNEISLKEFFEVKLEALDKALRLQAREYERRLDSLNNEARHLKDMQSTYFPRESWIIAEKQMQEEFRKFNKFMDTLAGMASQKSVNTATFLSIMGAISGIVGFLIAIIKLFIK